MGKESKSLNDIAWEKLFEKYDVLQKVKFDDIFEISASQIKEFREPRLMVKFDHKKDLPHIFIKNNLTILPVTRGNYIIAHFDAYHAFEKDDNASVCRMPLPEHIQSLDYGYVPSEAIALNSALAAGIFSDFLEDDEIIPTVCGRMGSGSFDFRIASSTGKIPYNIKVNNSQMEIDAAYEGINSLALVEAKHNLADDFLVRQLYYPYRFLQSQIRITKTIRPVFLTYSNGIYRLYEYQFTEPENYNSLASVKQKKYSIEDTTITSADIQEVLSGTRIVSEPQLPFPQADSFERVINLCELLNE